MRLILNCADVLILVYACKCCECVAVDGLQVLCFTGVAFVVETDSQLGSQAIKNTLSGVLYITSPLGGLGYYRTPKVRLRPVSVAVAVTNGLTTLSTLLATTLIASGVMCV